MLRISASGLIWACLRATLRDVQLMLPKPSTSCMKRLPFLERVTVKRRYPLMSPWWIVFAATAGGVVGNSPITLFTFGLFLKPVSREFGWGRATFAVALFVFQIVGA